MRAIKLKSCHTDILRFIERYLKIFYSFIFDKKYSNNRGYTYNSYKKGPSQFGDVVGFSYFDGSF